VFDQSRTTVLALSTYTTHLVDQYATVFGCQNTFISANFTSFIPSFQVCLRLESRKQKIRFFKADTSIKRYTLYINVSALI